MQRLHEDVELREQEVGELYAEMRSMMTHLSDNHGDSNQEAKDHIYNLRMGMVNYFVLDSINIMAEYDEEALALFQEHFGKETDGVAQVSVVKYDTAKDAVHAFRKGAERRGEWDSGENYLIWCKATKGARIIQGKGKFYRVSGGASLAAETTECRRKKEMSCPVCGFCKPERLPGLYPVAATPVKRVRSDITAQEYITLDECWGPGREPGPPEKGKYRALIHTNVHGNSDGGAGEHRRGD